MINSSPEMSSTAQLAQGQTETLVIGQSHTSNEAGATFILNLHKFVYLSISYCLYVSVCIVFMYTQKQTTNYINNSKQSQFYS